MCLKSICENNKIIGIESLVENVYWKKKLW